MYGQKMLKKFEFKSGRSLKSFRQSLGVIKIEAKVLSFHTDLGIRFKATSIIISINRRAFKQEYDNSKESLQTFCINVSFIVIKKIAYLNLKFRIPINGN